MVRFLKNKESGKFAPIEVEPSANGNIRVKDGFYKIASPEEISQCKAKGEPLFLNHFATCKFSGEFRRDK